MTSNNKLKEIGTKILHIIIYIITNMYDLESKNIKVDKK